MDLEQRVTMLEQELQILKNQIQATLLDIQEHLLTHTYPSLRAEGEPSQSESNHVKTISANPAKVVTPKEHPQETISQVQESIVRQVSLGDANPHADQPTPEPGLDPLPSHEPAPRANGVRVMPALPPIEPELAENAPHRAYRVNTPSRKKNGHAQDLKVNPFVIDDDLPPAAAADNTPISSADWATLEQLESWTVRRINKLGPKRTRELIKEYAAEGRIAPNVKDSLLQLVSIVTGDTVLHGVDSSFLMADREPVPLNPAATSSHNGTPPAHAEEDSDDAVSPNLILRLIAGIANSGASSSRGKKHG